MYHSFDVDVATKYGVNAAILFNNLSFLCEHNRTNGTNFHDGNYWTYNTLKAFSEQYPYMTEKQIRLAIDRLVEAGLVVKGNFNKLPYDRTTWYAITDEGKLICRRTQSHLPSRAYGSAPQGEPIPDINTDINTDISDDEYENPFGETDDSRPSFDTIEVYATNNLSVMGARAMEELHSFAVDLSEELVRHAIDNALDNGVRNWAYVKAILNSYAEAGVKTVGEAKAMDAKRKKGGTPEEPAQDAKPFGRMTPEEQAQAMKSGPFGKWY